MSVDQVVESSRRRLSPPLVDYVVDLLERRPPQLLLLFHELLERLVDRLVDIAVDELSWELVVLLGFWLADLLVDLLNGELISSRLVCLLNDLLVSLRLVACLVDLVVVLMFERLCSWCRLQLNCRLLELLVEQLAMEAVGLWFWLLPSVLVDLLFDLLFDLLEDCSLWCNQSSEFFRLSVHHHSHSKKTRQIVSIFYAVYFNV